MQRRRAACVAHALSFALMLVPPVVSAQQTPVERPRRDTTTRHDSATTRLAPIEVRASIAPTAGPTVGSAVPARISVVGRREIEGSSPRTVPDLLSARTGASFYDDLGSPYKLTLTARGFNAGPTVGVPPGVSVFLDGIRQNEPDAQEVNFDLLPMEHVERVELLSGNASLLGPNSLGGAVNLVTRRGDGPQRGELELSSGSFGAFGGQASFGGSPREDWDYYASGGYEAERGWREATRARRHNALLNVGHGDAAHGLRLQAYAARSRAETAGSLPESIFDQSPRTNFTTGDFEDLDAQQLALTGYAPVGGGSGSFAAYFRHSAAERFNVNQPPNDDVRSRTANGTVGWNADWRRTAVARGTELAFRAGVDGGANRVRVRIFAEPTAGGASADSLTTDVRSPSWELSAYGIVDARIGRVTLSGGARYDRVHVPFRNLLDPTGDTTSTFAQLDPRAGLSIDVGGGAMAYVSVGRSFRAPAILELGCADPSAACPLPFALGEDPPLNPVRATTYEAGGHWARGAVLLNASAYRTEVRDEIFFVASETAPLAGFFTNVPRTRRNGVELAAELSLPDGRAQEYVSYTYTRATFETAAQIFSIRARPDLAASPLAGSNDVRPGARIPLTPEHQVKAGATAQLPGGVELGADARYIGRQWLRGDEANETAPLDPYAIVDARVGIERGRWRFSVVADNLGNSHRATFGTFNENQRTGELERFLTPLTGRTVRLVLRRGLGSA